MCLTARQEGAWHEFVHRFQPLIAAVVVKTLRRCVHPTPNLVDDLVQETYLKLCVNDFRALRDFECRHEHALAGFLKTVASNVTQDYLRSALSIKRGSGKGEDNLDDAVPARNWLAGPVESMEREIVLRQVERCLERECAEPNFERDCKIFWLYYRNGLTAQDISRQPDVGLTVKGVESALFRLTQMLKVRLGGSRARRQTVRMSVA
ncbi:MAG TPA: sigma-70 family RNA polymerase sigma factor [Candidatus Angelobacter sp.]|nr:sigma-70 family RNA polymerase sigma factor [Candidatus Angelobacter sp.]